MYQSSNYRRSQPAQDVSTNKYNAQALRLQELFSDWTIEGSFVRPSL